MRMLMAAAALACAASPTDPDATAERVPQPEPPAIGLMIAGREVTEENRHQLYMSRKGVWR